MVRVKDKADDTSLTFSAKDTGNASICIGEMAEYVNGGPGILSANVAIGISETLSTKTLDERALTNWDKTCGATPSLTLEGGKLVLTRANGTICKTYQQVP